MEAYSASPSSTKSCSVDGFVEGKTEKTMEHEADESSVSQGVATRMAFKEHQVKQMRAQCLVYLAFKNQTMPKELHLKIALGKSHTNTDQSSKDFIEQEGNEQCVATIIHYNAPNHIQKTDSAKGIEGAEGKVEENILKDAKKPGRMDDNLPNINDLNLEENVEVT